MVFRIKTLLLQAAAVVMVTVGLCGCAGDGMAVSDPEGKAGGHQKNQAMGRYTENEVSLPDGITYGSVISFQNGPDGRPVLFTREDKDGMAEFTGYLLSEDLTWEERACGWLNRLGLSYEDSHVSISYGEDHKLYAAYFGAEDQEQTAARHVVMSEDWVNSREIPIPVVTEINKAVYHDFPDSVTALKNGNLLFGFSGDIYLYDVSGRRRLADIYCGKSAYFVCDNQLYVIDKNSKSLLLYDGSDGKEKAGYPLELDDYFDARMAAGENGDLSLVSEAGIQILKKGTGIWEQIVECLGNTMGSPNYFPVGFAVGGQEDYFVYYGSMDETSRLAHYVYQPDMPVEPETELTIFSLYDNETIKQGINEFQIENPNVKIEFQPLLEDSDTADAGDYIKTLNAGLLSGDGPDILILDGLSEASYIQKGILEDLTDEIGSLVSSGDFLNNIADACKVNGKIYSVPVKIGLPLTFGRKHVLKEAAQLSSLADLVESQKNGQVFGTVDREKLLAFYADVFLNNVVDGEVIQEQALNSFLLNMKRILDGSRISDGTEENRPSRIWSLLENNTYLFSDEVAGFFQSESGASVMEQAKGEMEADMIFMNHVYIPYGTIGINKAGKNKALAIRFLHTVLSKKVQSSDFYDGFAVNQNALEYLTGIERHSADMYGDSVQGTDGKIYEIKDVWPAAPLRRRLADFCESAVYSAGRYQKIKQILLEYSKGYFDGTDSLEVTVKVLMSKLSLYLKE